MLYFNFDPLVFKNLTISLLKALIHGYFGRLIHQFERKKITDCEHSNLELEEVNGFHENIFANWPQYEPIFPSDFHSLSLVSTHKLIL